MKKNLPTVLKGLLVLVLAVSLVNAGWKLLDYQKGNRDYREAEQLAGLRQQGESETTATQGETEGAGFSEAEREKAGETMQDKLGEEASGEPEALAYEDPVADALAETDLAALREVNSDVVGWITIPETELSYPLLRAEDNDFYLKRNWKKERSAVGSIYLECQVSPDFSDFNTIVYGHRMRNDSMFGSLSRYGSLAWWEEHPSIYIVDDQGVRRYDIFAAYEVGTDVITFGLGISSRPKKEEFIRFGVEQSVIDTGVVPTTLDKILTLSTCTGVGYSKRWVVQAVLGNGAPPWLQEDEADGEGGFVGMEGSSGNGDAGSVDMGATDSENAAGGSFGQETVTVPDAAGDGGSDQMGFMEADGGSDVDGVWDGREADRREECGRESDEK